MKQKHPSFFHPALILLLLVSIGVITTITLANETTTTYVSLIFKGEMIPLTPTKPPLPTTSTPLPFPTDPPLPGTATSEPPPTHPPLPTPEPPPTNPPLPTPERTSIP